LFIVFAVGICFATALLGMVVIMPVLGYTTWHAYQATIKPEAWPEHSKVPSA